MEISACKIAALLCAIILLFTTSKVLAQDKETENAMSGIRSHASLRKANRNPLEAKKVYFKNYTDTVFPNDAILKFENLESLALNSPFKKNKTKDTLSLAKIRIDVAKMKKLTRLRYLFLEGFDFSIFPEELFELTQLKGLTIAVCKIKALPAGIAKLTELSYLELRVNEISNLPEEIKQMKTLEVLDMDNNRFTSIPGQVLALPNFRYLSMGNSESSKVYSENQFFPLNFYLNEINCLTSYVNIKTLLLNNHFEYLCAGANNTEEEVQMLLTNLEENTSNRKLNTRYYNYGGKNNWGFIIKTN